MTNSSSEADLQTVMSRLAIGEVLARYCRAVDRMDRDLALSVWHDDGTCHYEGFYDGSARGLVDAVWEAHAALFRHTHQIANSVIEVDGDHAVSETYVTATLWGDPTDDGMLEIVSTGRYLDRWSRRDGRWAIDHRIELGDVSTMRTLRPAAWFRASELTTRDANDPSYELFRSLNRRETPPPDS